MGYNIDESRGDIEFIVDGGSVYLKLKAGAGGGGGNGGGGSNVILIKLGEATPATDGNAYSALRARDEFLKRKEEDTAQKKITFLEGWQVGANFAPGLAGSGAALLKEGENWNLHIDNLSVRKSASFTELVIEAIKGLSGQVIVSVGEMKCTSVEDTGTAYRCYFDNQNGAAPNSFVQGDQAICQKFTGRGVKRYWRLVTAAGANYIDLSKTDAEAGSGVPVAGDDILQLGNRQDASRQSAVVLSAKGGQPTITFYTGINRFDLAGKEQTVIGENGKFRGVIEALGGTFSGYVKMPLVDIRESDAVSTDDVNFLLKNNLNISLSCTSFGSNIPNIILPYDPSYVGAVVNVIDTYFGPYTKSGAAAAQVSVQVYPNLDHANIYQSICGTFRTSTEFNNDERPMAISFVGSHLQFIGVPGAVPTGGAEPVPITRWVVVNYKP